MRLSAALRVTFKASAAGDCPLPVEVRAVFNVRLVTFTASPCQPYGPCRGRAVQAIQYNITERPQQR
jgi:hypothetical protein